MRIHAVPGNGQRLDGGAMFGNAPRAVWSKWLAPDEQNRVALACRCLLVEDLDGKNVLFETGIGAFFEPRLRERYGVQESRHVLLDELSARGFADDDIDVVVLSHLHFDHAGGLLAAWQPDSTPRLLFPRARYLVGAEHWRRALAPHPRDRASFIPGLPSLLEASGRLRLVDGAHDAALGPCVRFHFSDGHTPGLMLAEVQPGPGAAGGVLYCADLIPGVPWVHVPITMGYDRYPERLIDEKQALLDDALARGVRLFFTHDPLIAMATLTCDEGGRFGVVDGQPTLEAVGL